jgi:hypothetical protein
LFCPKCGKEATESSLFCTGCGHGLAAVPPANRNHLSLAAGILEIVSGVFLALLAAFLLVTMGIGTTQEDGPPVVLLLLPLAFLAMGALGIAGGICALQRRKWGLALAGAIAVVLPTSYLGIAALVLVALARDEFEEQPPSR